MAKPLGGAFYLTQCFVPNNFSPISVQQPQKGKRSLRKKRKNKKKNKNERAYICVYRMCDSYKSIFTRLGDWVGDQFDMYF